MKQKLQLCKSKLFFIGLGLLIFSGLSAQTDPGTVNLMHQWTFEDGTANDAIRTGTPVDGTLSGVGSITGGAYVNTTGTTNTAAYLSFSGTDLNLNAYTAITLESWATSLNYSGNTAMMAYFGNTPAATGSNYCFMGTSGSKGATKGASVETSATGVSLNNGALQLHHLVYIMRSDSMLLYVDGVKQMAKLTPATSLISSIGTAAAYFGRSGWTGDPAWQGRLYKFSIYNKALSAAEILYLFQNGDNTFVPTVSKNYFIHFATGSKVIGSNAGVPSQRFVAPNVNSQLFQFVAVSGGTNTYYLLNAEGNYLTRGSDASSLIYSSTIVTGKSEWLISGNSMNSLRIINPNNVANLLGSTATIVDGTAMTYNNTVSNLNTYFYLSTPTDVIGVNMFDPGFENSAPSAIITTNEASPIGKWVPSNASQFGFFGTSRVITSTGWETTGTKCFNLRFNSATDVAPASNSISQKLYGLTAGKAYKYTFKYKNSSATTLVAVYAAATANADSTVATRIGAKFITSPTGSTVNTQSALTGSVIFTAPSDSCYIIYRKNVASDAYMFYIDDLTLSNIPLISATATTGGTVSGAGLYDVGASVSLVATPNSGYRFINWTENGIEVSTNATYTFTSSVDKSFIANFDLGTSIETANETKNLINVYRNVNGLIAVDCSTNAVGQASVSVYNAVGQILVNEKLISTKTVLTRICSPGVYLVNVTYNGKNLIRKVVIN